MVGRSFRWIGWHETPADPACSPHACQHPPAGPDSPAVLRIAGSAPEFPSDLPVEGHVPDIERRQLARAHPGRVLE